MSSLIARFQPEAWVNDYAIAVDPEGPTTWDPESWLEQVGPHLFAEIRAAFLEDRVWVDSDDVLKEDPSAPPWVQDWRGPFTITVEAGPSWWNDS